MFFEPRDLEFNVEFFHNPEVYIDNPRYADQIKSQSYSLRKRDLNGSSQKIDVQLLIKQQREIAVKYIVHNSGDKLDIVVTLTPEEVRLNHYHTEMRRPRDKAVFPKDTHLELKESESKNWVIKGEIGESYFNHYLKPNQMSSEYILRVLKAHPVFIGGNGFSDIVAQIQVNYAQIIDAAKQAKTPIQKPEFANPIKGLENVVVS